MRRIVIGLAAIAVASGAVLVAFLTIAAQLMVENAGGFSTDQNPSQREVEESERIAQIVSSLGLACGPLAAATVLAVVAILVLLAVRWELRQAPAR